MSWANFGEPATLVRSPMLMKLVFGTDGERVQSAQAADYGSTFGGTARRQALDRGSAIAWIWAGVVPQQPPTMFNQPFCAHSRKLRRQRFRGFGKAGRQQGIGQTRRSDSALT